MNGLYDCVNKRDNFRYFHMRRNYRYTITNYYRSDILLYYYYNYYTASNF